MKENDQTYYISTNYSFVMVKIILTLEPDLNELANGSHLKQQKRKVSVYSWTIQNYIEEKYYSINIKVLYLNKIF